MDIGQIKIFPLSDGIIRLDGGAMFGVVPQALWKVKSPPDTRNRVALSLNCLLIFAGGKKILVDTGVGSKYDDNKKFLDRYGIERRTGLYKALERYDVTADDIDIVINTHLHFDHAGGNTIKSGDDIVAAFKNAVYVVQKGEYDFAVNANERTRANYLQENFLPITKQGKWEFVNGDSEIVKGVKVRVTSGHTEHHQIVYVESDEVQAVFMGDLVPTSAHMPLPFIMGFDTLPLVTLEAKRKLFDEFNKKKTLLVFQHDPNVAAAYFTRKSGKDSVEGEIPHV